MSPISIEARHNTAHLSMLIAQYTQKLDTRVDGRVKSSDGTSDSGASEGVSKVY